jgi:hypothetical protein
MLQERSSLRDSIYINMEEKVAMFLLVVGHGLKNNIVAWHLQMFFRDYQ